MTSMKSMTAAAAASTIARRLRTVVRTLAIAAAPALIAAPSWAFLGGNTAYVSADSAELNGQLRTTPTVQYDMHEITNDGLTVHEYVTRQGQVFAITWQGPFKPDLRQLLGDYFSRYQSAAEAVPRAGGHRVFSMTAPDLVVQSAGR